MKIKLDENMPGDLKVALAQLGYDVDTVKDEGLGGESDPKVWEAAQRAGRFFITHDIYFTDVRVHPPGKHQGVLVLRLAAADRDEVTSRVVQIFKNFEVKSWRGCNVVAGLKTLRVRRS